MTQAYPLAWPPGWPRTPAHNQERGERFVTWTDNYRDGHAWRSKGLVSFAKARDGLLDEVARLGARNVVLSSNHPLDRHGVPREGRRVEDEGIAIYFTLKGKALAMACDRYVSAAANMRSLALAIDAMRQLERHGGGAMIERAFSGFAALPAPGSPWEVLGIAPTKNTAAINDAYRAKARATHPDAGGSADQMARLNAARDQALRYSGSA
jgi:hypothetical protein